jgi:hypothetical protein
MSGDGLPFREAIEHFRQKVNMPTARWTDMIGGQHARAFTVAGATREAILVDFRTALDKVISQGTTLEEFRRDFDSIVAKHGWSYNGSRNWRSKLIYDTNLRTAAAAGRWKQMTDPDVARYRPWWRYVHDDSVAHPRPEHQAWDGLVLAADDPWIRTHATPNGWGCECRWEALSRRDLKALGKSGPDQAPAEDSRPVTLSTSSGPVTIEVPAGVDPGWGQSVGESAFGRQLPEAEMEAWRQRKADAWEPLTPGNWQSAKRPEHLPVDPPEAKLGPKAGTVDQLARQIATALGGDQVAVPLPDGSSLLVDAPALARHLDLARSPWVPLLPELLTAPAEIWAMFLRHKGTGRVILRKRLVKVVGGDGGKGLILVVDAGGGFFHGWTFMPSNRPGYLNSLRAGRLLWSR